MKSILTALLLLSFYFVHAQEFNTTKADSLLYAIESNEQGMGAVAILKSGKTVYENAYGFANVSTQAKNTNNTLFRIGSISKTYTASLVMMAVEEGLLSLDDKLSLFYSNFKYADKITISQMLQHRSGLYNFTNSPEYVQYMTDSKTKDELLEIFLSADNSFEPDEKFEYSNTAYVLLSYILEDVYDMSYGEILRKKITDSLKLKNTYFGKDIDESKNEANSYFRSATWEMSPETNMFIPMGAGGITATARDVATFYEALFDGEILKASSLAKMKTLKDGFGYGLFEMPYYDQMILGHTGGIDAFQSVAVHFDSEDLTVVVICNAVSYSRNDILLGLLSAYFGKEFEIPDFTPDLVLKVEDLIGFEGVYSSPSFPLKITISIGNDNQLMAQATGQSAFPLTAVDKYNFKFEPAGIEIHFDSEAPKFTLSQNGMQFQFDKE